ncbi:MAG: threonine--tRNA ligase [Patescibacteria group bacterium]
MASVSQDQKMALLGDSDKLQGVRHSCAHLLAAAVRAIWPGAKNAIGPAIENGFYQDFDLGEVKISEEDFPKIEEKMREIVKTWGSFAVKEVSAEQARKDFAWNEYKLELIDEFAAGGKMITENDPGGFLDLCRGGHSENPAQEMQHFKILNVAGAYWRGDEKNKVLTRIYGTCFATKEALDEYLKKLEEAKKRDHKLLGKTLELFTHSPLVGGGLPLFLPRGAQLKRNLEEYIRAEKVARGYSFVCIPHIAKDLLYEKSGHLGKYDAMMPIMEGDEGDAFVMKAMNCPHHFELYRSLAHSYRELPLRYAENTVVYRNEKSGEVNGLFRVRALTQDDTHHFVRHDQIESEIDMILGLTKSVYDTFDFKNYKARISIRDPKNPDKYFGDNDLWDKAEKKLVEAIKRWGSPYFIGEGEAAFYGPKIDLMVEDALGREWQLTTVQLDFTQPENFDLTYTGEDGKAHRPAILHVAILGSIERFMGIIIEHFAGAFPAWLAPVQARVLPVGQDFMEYGNGVFQKLREAGVRVEIDSSNETLGKKIRAGEMMKIPYLLVVGQKEKDAATVAVRNYATKEQKVVTVEEFLQLL